MMNIYNFVKGLFPTIYMPNTRINKQIEDVWYILNDTELEGTRCGMYKNFHLIRAYDIGEYYHELEYIFESELQRVFVVPYDIDSELNFSTKNRTYIIYNIFDRLVSSLYNSNTKEMENVLHYAPLVLTIYLLSEMGMDIIEEVIEILSESNEIKYPEEFISDFRNLDIDVLINKCGLYPLLEKYNLIQ